MLRNWQGQIMNDALIKERNKVVDYISRQLLGPFDGEEEVLSNDTPNQRYLLGTLFPKNSEQDQIQNEDNQEIETIASDSDQPEDSPMSAVFQKLPASIGLSFFVENTSHLEISVWGALYEEQKDDQLKGKTLKKNWVRRPIASKDNPETIKLEKDLTVTVLENKAKIHTIWRPMGNGYLITVTLINLAENTPEEKLNPEQCIYQAGFRCNAIKGEIKEYPSVTRLSFDEEEEELALQYSDKVSFAIGHGCSATWDVQSKIINFVETAWMPIHEIKDIGFEIDSSLDTKVNFLSLNFLSNKKTKDGELIKNLNLFLNGYKYWYKNLINHNVDHKFKEAKTKILKRVSVAIERIQTGINLIEKDDQVRQSFKIANEAMLRQMIYAKTSNEKNRNSKKFLKHDFYSDEYKDFQWRPFQLAFQLLVIESLVNKDSDYRNTLDLIWFPTGGGKTESYLAVAAFELIYRRIKYGQKGFGTAVIKRYTLRLLTAQQFQRAAVLICALELMRRENIDLLLSEPFSLGLWLGEASTPNKFTDSNEKGAKEIFKNVRNEEKPRNPFQLLKCPVCGTKIIPNSISEDNADYGIIATETTFKFYCPSNDCDLHERIPVSVVDEDIYLNPPSFLIGTIDKFARLSWDSRAKNLFGKENIKPPYLIIQDELHLISGPLGTVSGIYEAAISTVIKSKEHIEPKYIAATATIRRSADQVKKLYGREVNVFPPPGISSDDSYFAKTNFEKIGRLYIGLMPQGKTPVTSLVHCSAALSQAAIEAKLDNEYLKDAYWTQIIYHNSRRELGKTVTLCNDDIPSRIKVIAKDQDDMRALTNIEELSATRDSSDIPIILSRLSYPFNNLDMIDILPCTNMISVGVDVSRLGLMLIYGQPKTTAEYIQASSRVGRKSEQYPGIVITLYTATKPRDRSHYEDFVTYHNAIYKYVEPTSVTPFAPKAQERALHAAFIIIMRQAGGLNENNEAKLFDPNNKETQALIELFRERLLQADPQEKEIINSNLENIINKWMDMIEQSKNLNKPLVFSADGRQFMPLMTYFGKGNEADSWQTLNSMRNVDAEASIYLQGSNN